MPAATLLDTSLDRAAALCARRGAQLTELRWQVLRLVLEAGQPVGAYALLDRLKASRAGAAPPTVYRALDFLVEQGLIHKVERLGAFIGCAEVEDHPLRLRLRCRPRPPASVPRSARAAAAPRS